MAQAKRAVDLDWDLDRSFYTPAHRRPWYEVELELSEDMSHTELAAMAAATRPAQND
jgi:hypothetical protein